MRLTVLGKYGPYPRPGGSCSGYLVEEGDTAILLECGCGTLSRLLQHIPLSKLKGVFLSHLHWDHVGDVPILRYALEQGQGITPLPLWAPAGFAAGDSPVFQYQSLSKSYEISMGTLQISTYGVKHIGESYAFSVCRKGGKRLFYTGDTRYFSELPAYALGADALLADVCLLDKPEGKEAFHMTAGEAGELAKQAKAKRLLCTHIWGGGGDEKEILVKTGFANACVVQEGTVYEI